MRICLVVDHMPVTRRIYCLLLQKIGFTMVKAGSVEEALSNRIRPNDLALKFGRRSLGHCCHENTSLMTSN